MERSHSSTKTSGWLLILLSTPPPGSALLVSAHGASFSSFSEHSAKQMGRSSLAQKDVGSVTPSTQNTLPYQKLKCQIQKQQHLGLETLRGLLNCGEEIKER